VELFEALALAGIGQERCRFLDVPDQEASFHLAGITRSLVEILALMKPSLVLAPPYEGGHPDHDAVAFAVNTAVHLNARRGAPPIPVVEYAMYHIGESGWAIYEFLSSWERPERTVVLTDGERELKSKMMRCFRSQRNVLAAFPDTFERFRMAPDYDFTKPPHEGALLYERYDWGISGDRWRTWVKWALTELGEGK
jgi:LmbE family N-acetylglucosaminyl deacetylase